MNCTVRDVARLAGVSPSTASRALSRPEMISAETRARVLEAARALGWIPNRLARSLTKGSTQNVGIVVPDIVNPFFPPLIRGAQQEAWTRSFSVLLGDSNENSAREFHVARELSTQVDGLLLVSSRLAASEIAELRERCEVVLVNRIIKGVSSVVIDTATGVRRAVQHFVETGHRQVHYVSGPAGSWSNAQRVAALEAECEARGIACRILAPSVGAFERGRACVDDLLAAGATAVLAYDDITALGIIAGLADKHVRVPDDVSIIGCDDIPMAGQLGLATISVPLDAVGSVAVALLIDLIAERTNAQDRRARRRRVPGALVLRATAGSARAGRGAGRGRPTTA